MIVVEQSPRASRGGAGAGTDRLLDLSVTRETGPTVVAGPVSDRDAELGTILRGRLNALRAADPRVGDVRGSGATMEFALLDAAGAPDVPLARRVALAARQEGVVVGTAGHVVRVSAPASVDDARLVEGLRVVLRAVLHS